MIGFNRIILFFYVLFAVHIMAALLAWAVQPNFVSGGVTKALSVSLWDDPAVRAAPVILRRFDGRALSGLPLRVLVPAHAGDVAVAINGRSLTPLPGAPHSAISRHHRMTLFAVPAGLIGNGQNILMVERRGAMRFLTIPEVLIGRTNAVDRLAAEQRLLLTWVDRATLFSMVAGMIMSLILLFMSRRITHYIYLSIVFGILFLLEFRDQFSLFGQPLVNFIQYFGLTYRLMAALSFSHWTQGSRTERRVALWLYGVAMMLCAISDIGWGVGSEATAWVQKTTFMLSSIVLLAWVSFRLIRLVRTFDLAGTIVFACLAAVGAAFGVALITVWGGPVSVEQRLLLVCFTNSAEVIGLIGLLCMAGGHELMRYRASLSQRGRLDSIASGTMMALEEETVRLKQTIEGQAVRDERQRFTRDMHDGIGGQLLSLLLKARTGNIDPERLESEIARCISDLRLITAALDVGEDSLTAALAAFRARTEDQLRLAGMAFDWSCTAAVEAVDTSPHVTLELLRILQELVTNAITHADADRLAISIDTDELSDGAGRGPSSLCIDVSDSGVAFDPARAQLPGRGLANMQARVRRLDGSVEIGRSSSGGAAIRLTLAVGTETPDSGAQSVGV